MKIILIFCGLIIILFGCRFTSGLHQNETIVCINFDDNCQSVFNNALPVMNQYGFKGSVFVNSGRVGSPNWMSWDQLEQLKNIYDWEIGGHSLNHELLSGLALEAADLAISSDFDSLTYHGLNPVSFATPYGYCPNDYYKIITRYYKNIRTCFNVPMFAPIDRTSIGSFGIYNNMSAEDAVSRVIQGKAAGENLIVLLFHDITDTPTEYLSTCDKETFAQIMRLMHDRGIKVMTLDKAVDYLSE